MSLLPASAKRSEISGRARLGAGISVAQLTRVGGTRRGFKCPLGLPSRLFVLFQLGFLSGRRLRLALALDVVVVRILFDFGLLRRRLGSGHDDRNTSLLGLVVLVVGGSDSRIAVDDFRLALLRNGGRFGRRLLLGLDVDFHRIRIGIFDHGSAFLGDGRGGRLWLRSGGGASHIVVRIRKDDLGGFGLAHGKREKVLGGSGWCGSGCSRRRPAQEAEDAPKRQRAARAHR